MPLGAAWDSKVFTIPPVDSFVDALAAGLIERFPEPEALAAVTIFLPTRRAGRTLSEAFLRQGGGRPLLLPALKTLGDLDAEEISAADETFGGWPDAALLDPAFPPLKRQLILAEQVIAWHKAQDRDISAEQAVLLAGELARLIDQVETEGLDFDGLNNLVEDSDLARHWDLTLQFLSIVTQNWPKIEEEEGVIGAARRRRLLLERQAELWAKTPPRDPVIAAGSTGTIPAARALMKSIADAPLGAVVLPGLDQDMPEETWEERVAEDPTHPQFAMAELLDHLGVTRAEVKPWRVKSLTSEGLRAAAPSRTRFINTALWPAVATAAWRRLDPFAPGALEGLRRFDLPDSEREAQVIALLLREALVIEGKTAALVTPDRDLARRVAAAMTRWGVEIDDSAGQPLSVTPPGVFLRAVADLAQRSAGPLAILSALKHPLAALGEAPGAFRRKVRLLEIAALRGARPQPGFAALKRIVAEAKALGRRDKQALADLLTRLEAAVAPLTEALKTANLEAIARAHASVAETLAASDEADGPTRLWAGEAGDAAARFLDELARHGAASRLSGADYAAMLESLLAQQEVRPPWGGHPRLQILGPLEARLWRADRMILGGLNEGTWPAETDPGPWMSRAMRRDFGLPAVERRIGLAGHDFCQAAAAPEVFLTRAERVEGAPAVPSRWLLRLEALLEAQGLDAEQLSADAAQWLAWAKALDAPAEPPAPWPRPAPRPPVAARPRELSVTRIETWIGDPYMLYAREILRLKALDPIDADASAAERGVMLHEIMQRFLEATADGLPDDPAAAALLREIGDEIFEALSTRPAVRAIWTPRFERLIPWIIAQERKRRTPGVALFAEASGATTLDGFTLKAKADRIERHPDGRLAILDYKTGGAPSAKMVCEGKAPQLPLEAAILKAGGFPGLEAPDPAAEVELCYWELKGRQTPGEEKPIKPKDQDLAADAAAGLARLVAAYADPKTPYLAQPRPDLAPRYNDYAYLERLAEWSAGGEGESE